MYSWIFVLGHYICLSELTVFLELRSSFLEQNMSTQKYQDIFPRQMETIVYLLVIFERILYDTSCKIS